MVRRFFILATLFLHAFSGAADAADLRLRWVHEGAAEFIVVVDQPTSAQSEPMVVSWPLPEPEADGRFAMIVSEVDPNHDAEVYVVAIDETGTSGEPSNIIHVSAAEFCGSVSCWDALACTHDICGDGFCANSPDNSRCEDFNECTQDFCDLAEGCVHLFTTGSCNDGLDCTVFDSCADGVCAGIPDCPEGTYCSEVTGDCELGASTTTSTTLAVMTSSTTSTSLELVTTTTTTTTVPEGCGNGVVELDEQCDNGLATWEAGDGCGEDCRFVTCGDPDGSGALSLVDALYILYAALGRHECDPSVCNVDSNLDSITASDALRLLRVIVGIPLELDCPPL